MGKIPARASFLARYLSSVHVMLRSKLLKSFQSLYRLKISPFAYQQPLCILPCYLKM